jgi:hypothetical protein
MTQFERECRYLLIGYFGQRAKLSKFQKVKTKGQHVAAGVNICPNIFHSITAIQPSVGPWPLFQFLTLYTVGRTGGISPSQGLYLHTEQHKRKGKVVPVLN